MSSSLRPLNLPRPQFTPREPVPLDSGNGVSVRTYESTCDPNIQDSNTVKNVLESRGELFPVEKVKMTTRAPASQSSDENREQVAQPLVDTVSAKANKVVVTRDAWPQVEEVRAEDWRSTASSISNRINNQLTIRDQIVNGGPVMQVQAEPLRKTVVHKKTEEPRVPEFFARAKAMTQAAASRLDPNDGNLIITRGARSPMASIHTSHYAKPTERSTPEPPAQVQSVSNEPRTASPRSSESSSESSIEQEVAVIKKPTVSLAEPVQAATPSETESTASSSVSLDKSNEREELAESTTTTTSSFLSPVDGGVATMTMSKEARAEWKARVESIKHNLPDMLDESLGEVKRDAIEKVREQHKNSRSLVAQLAKTPIQKTVQASAQQKRSAYHSFVAAPAQIRHSWLPEPEPVGFEVERRPSRTNSSASSRHEEVSHVLRSKSNVGNATSSTAGFGKPFNDKSVRTHTSSENENA